jgi:2'-hydroxyisoflavone reductase
MRILVIGGGRLVGRPIIERALEHDHDVTVFNRGQTAPGAFGDRVTELVGDRSHDLSALEDGEWDATVDITAYTASNVRDLLETLGSRAGHYTLVSTISVYDPPDDAESLTEDSPLLEAYWGEERGAAHYGAAKVACEQVAADLAGDRLLVVRPGFVVGAYDYTMRFPYWIERVERGGVIVGPDADQPLQVVDSRDLGAFTLGAVERQVVDTVHVCAPAEPPTFRDVLETIGETLRAGTPDVRWLGPRDELPLSLPKDAWVVERADTTRARDHGLWTRPVEDTIREVHRWIAAERDGGDWHYPDGVGLAPQRERDLVAAADAGER